MKVRELPERLEAASAMLRQLSQTFQEVAVVLDQLRVTSSKLIETLSEAEKNEEV